MSQSGYGMHSRNSTLNQSAASLRDILEERNDQFEVLEPSKMYGDGQKNQMNKLNVQLRDYMKMNKDLDNQIASLNTEISKAKHNANYQDDDIKRKIMTVTARGITSRSRRWTLRFGMLMTRLIPRRGKSVTIKLLLTDFCRRKPGLRRLKGRKS